MVVMKRIVEKKMKCNKWRRNCGHLLSKKLEENIYQAYNGMCILMVMLNIKLKEETIICNSSEENAFQTWNLFGIPCCHAIYAIWDNKEELKDYIHEWYH